MNHSEQHHSVVPIGGAPFVPPLKSLMQNDHMNNEELIARRNSKSISRKANGGGNHQINSSPTPSPTMSTSPLSDFSSYSSVSSSPDSDASSNSPTNGNHHHSWEAAIRYTSALHEHTRRMWEQERLSIERTKLGLSSEPSSGSLSSSSSSSSAASPPSKSNGSNSLLQKRSTLSGMESLWKGRKKHSKNHSISEFRS